MNSCSSIHLELAGQILQWGLWYQSLKTCLLSKFSFCICFIVQPLGLRLIDLNMLCKITTKISQLVCHSRYELLVGSFFWGKLIISKSWKSQETCQNNEKFLQFDPGTGVVGQIRFRIPQCKRSSLHSLLYNSNFSRFQGQIQRFWKAEAFYVSYHGNPMKKILSFRWSKKTKITLETISFWQNISVSI